MASYPTTIKTFAAVNDGDTISDEMFEEAYDEITAIETDLVNGKSHPLRLAAATEFTIATGAITVTKGYIKIDTEADAASDDLDTITPGTNVGEGSIIVCRAENTARVVTLKDSTGNLLLNGDYSLNATDRTITLIFDGSNWREMARSTPHTGTYVPAVESSGGGAANYTTQTGRWIRDGKLVHFQARVVLANKGTLAAGTVTITLPFTEVAAFFPLAVGQFAGMTTAVVGLFCTVTAGTGKANIYHLAAAATGTTATTVADIGVNVDLTIGGTYEAAT